MKYFLLISLFVNTAFATTTIRCDYDNSLNQVEFSLHSFEQQSFQKEFEVKDKKIKIFVKNIKTPTDVDDYITISNTKYKMTYPLSCKIFEPKVTAVYSPVEYR